MNNGKDIKDHVEKEKEKERSTEIEDEFDLLDEFDDFGVVDSTEMSREEMLAYDEYAPRIKWKVNLGMNHERMHKMYSLLADKGSNFYLTNLIAQPVKDESESYTFKSKTNENKVVLYKPGLRKATYATSPDNKEKGGISGDLEEILNSIKKTTITDPDTPIRFVIPFNEEPDNPSKGESHSVLLVVDYDPITKTITPRVLDSIGRDNFSDSFSKFWSKKHQSTADVILNERIQEIFNGSPKGVKAHALQRIAYNHQNRATEGNCGSYTFTSLYHSIQSFINGTPMEEFVSSIPSSGFITSDSYLNAKLVGDIESCVNFRSFDSGTIDTALQNIGKDESMEYKLTEFEDALIQYKTIRTHEAEKSLFSFGHTKDTKIEAVNALLKVVQLVQEKKTIPFELYEEIQKSKETINNGRLGKLVSYHLKKAHFDTIDHLLLSTNESKKYEEIEDFVLIPSEIGTVEKTDSKPKKDELFDELFEVGDISEKGYRA